MGQSHLRRTTLHGQSNVFFATDMARGPNFNSPPRRSRLRVIYLDIRNLLWTRNPRPTERCIEKGVHEVPSEGSVD